MTADVALRGYRLRAYPTPRQVTVLEAWQRAYARAWNTALAHRRDVFETQELIRRIASRSDRELPARADLRELGKALNDDLRDHRARSLVVAAAPAQVTNEALRRLDRAYAAAFARLARGQRPGFPRFMSWRDAPLIFSADARSLHSAGLDGRPSRTSGAYWVEAISDRHMILGFATPRNGLRLGHLKVRLHRPLPDPCRVRTLALTQKAGRWHAAVGIEAVFGGVCGDTAVGINRGVAVWVACSTGMLVEVDPLYPQYADRIVELQQRISRARRGSRRRAEQQRLLNRTWEKVAARRRQRAHELANLLVAEHSLIAIEDFDTARMLREPLPDEPAAMARALRRRITDAAWGDLARILEYKAAAAGGQVVKVDPAGITTTCSACGGDIGREAAAAVRGYRDVLCDCGARHHVDVNAARNVLAKAMTGTRAVAA